MFGGLNMSFWELIALVGTMATILGLFLTMYALINNKTLKEESKLTRESVEKVITEESRLTREIIAKIDERSGETLRGIGDTLKEVARLIVAESEKTRQTIKA